MYTLLMNSKILKTIVKKLEQGGKSVHFLYLTLKEENVGLLSEESGSSKKSLPTSMTFKQLLIATKLPIASIFVNLATTVVVSSFLTYVPSMGTFPSLVQALNYAMLVADFLVIKGTNDTHYH